MTNALALIEDFSQYVTAREETLGGVCVVLTFPNGWGASVINHTGAYGTELAVLNSEGDIDYSTPVTNDVLGWLDPETLAENLRAILALEPETGKLGS